VVRVGTSKGSTISQHGCSTTSGALATGALQKERKKERTEHRMTLHQTPFFRYTKLLSFYNPRSCALFEYTQQWHQLILTYLCGVVCSITEYIQIMHRS
jgi:hypothetical protein